MAVQESFQVWGIHSMQKIKDMSDNELISDPSTCLKNRAQRSEDSILLRHRDDVVRTGPEERFMSDFEHMKTSLYLTDVVLRHEGDTVNFFGLEITKTSKGFEVKNSADFVESFFESLRVGKTRDRRPVLAGVGRWWGSRRELLWVVVSTPTFAQPSENSSSWRLGDQTCHLPSNNYPQKSSLNPTTESKRTV